VWVSAITSSYREITVCGFFSLIVDAQRMCFLISTDTNGGLAVNYTEKFLCGPVLITFHRLINPDLAGCGGGGEAEEGKLRGTGEETLAPGPSRLSATRAYAGHFSGYTGPRSFTQTGPAIFTHPGPLAFT
jgi:hypothetical protein